MCSENKGADQLWSYCEADLHLCFRITAETQSGLPFVLHLRQKSNLFVFSFFLVYNNL